MIPLLCLKIIKNRYIDPNLKENKVLDIVTLTVVKE